MSEFSNEISVAIEKEFDRIFTKAKESEVNTLEKDISHLTRVLVSSLTASYLAFSDKSGKKVIEENDEKFVSYVNELLLEDIKDAKVFIKETK